MWHPVHWLLGVVALFMLVFACAPAAPPSLTAPPTEPAETRKSAAPSAATNSTDAPEARPASSVAKPVQAKPVASPAAKVAFDEKAVADFYRGKTVRIIVGFAPGGGFDTYSRAIARHLGKYIPGNPTVIVENMPGAGSLQAANHVYNTAPQDGTVIGNFQGGLVREQLFGQQGVQFDGLKFNWIGVPTMDHNLAITVKRSGITRLDQIMGPSGQELVIGGSGPGSVIEDHPRILNGVLGTRFKIVSGYQGTAPIRLALERGEIDAFFNSWESESTSSFEKFQSGEYVVLVQAYDGRIPPLSDVPTMMEFIQNEEQRRLLRFGIVIPSDFNRPYAMGPGVPQDRVQAIRTAFEQTLADRALLEEAQKANLDISPIGGAQLESLISEYLAMPADIQAKLKQYLAAS